MFGAVIGDIVGSIYEFDNIRTKDFPLFGKKCAFTDDSIMTLAVANALLETGDVRDETVLKDACIRNMKELGGKYPWPMGGYGGRFSRWLRSDDSEPYNSWGNGSAMRVSPCGFAAVSMEEALELARFSAEVTHNHPEAVAGAQVTAGCIFLARSGASKADIRDYVVKTYCEMNQSVAELRVTNRFTERCRDTVPPAIQAFLEAEDFEDAIRNVISIGGDSDTLAAITGGIAEAFFGVPEDISQKAREYLTPDLLSILDAFESRYQKG